MRYPGGAVTAVTLLYALLNSSYLSLRLNTANVCDMPRTVAGIAFQVAGPETEKLHDSYRTSRISCLSHPLGDLVVTHRVHPWLDGNRIVDSLLVIIKLSLALIAKVLLSKICRNRRFLKG